MSVYEFARYPWGGCEAEHNSDQIHLVLHLMTLVCSCRAGYKAWYLADLFHQIWFGNRIFVVLVAQFVDRLLERDEERRVVHNFNENAEMVIIPGPLD